MIAGMLKNWRFMLALVVCVSVVFAWQYDMTMPPNTGADVIQWRRKFQAV